MARESHTVPIHLHNASPSPFLGHDHLPHLCLESNAYSQVHDVISETDADGSGGDVVAILLCLYVAPSHRRCGVAHQCLDAVLRLVWAAHASRVIALVATRNLPAISLLSRLGFHRVENVDIQAEAHVRLELSATPTPLV